MPGAGASSRPRAGRPRGAAALACPGGVRGRGRRHGALLHRAGRLAPPGRALPSARWEPCSLALEPATAWGWTRSVPTLSRQRWCPRDGGRGNTAHCPGPLQLPVTLRPACVAGATGPGLAWVGTAGTGAVDPRPPGTSSRPWTTPWALTQVGVRQGRGPRATPTRGQAPDPNRASQPSSSKLPSGPEASGRGGQLHRVIRAPSLSRPQATLPSSKLVCWVQGAGWPGRGASLCPPLRPPASASGTAWTSPSASVSRPASALGQWGSRGLGQPCPGWLRDLTRPDPALRQGRAEGAPEQCPGPAGCVGRWRAPAAPVAGRPGGGGQCRGVPG